MPVNVANNLYPVPGVILRFKGTVVKPIDVAVTGTVIDATVARLLSSNTTAAVPEPAVPAQKSADTNVKL